MTDRVRGLGYAVPVLLLLVWTVLPLARGMETLYLRDVLNTHLEMKWAQAEALRAGYLPLLDPYRGGGQPLAGNLNAAPFHPTNLLYLAGSPLWALNAHFWLHLLAAPFAVAWMARRFGLDHRAAWAAGVFWALSGYYLSHMSFYNLVAGATLAPALVAACLAALDEESARRRGWHLVAVGLAWALLLVGGDPLMALQAFLLAAAAVAVLRRGAGLVPLGLAFAAGTLLAAPQLVELWRILPLSFRGHWGYRPEIATVASWDPRQLAEWLLPFVFGRPDLIGPGQLWGERFFTDTPPYYFSLYPGLLALALVAASGRPRSRAQLWAWGAVAVGLFFSLGRFNPLAAWLFTHGGGLLRYPVKLWLPVALGASLLCGVGFARLLDDEPHGRAARRTFGLALAALAALLALAWALLSLAPGLSVPALRRLVPATFPDAFVADERLRLSGLCLLSLVVLALLALAARLARRRPAAAGAVLLLLHAGAQLFLLRPLVATDAAAPYLLPPPALTHVPRGARVVHGSFEGLFGPARIERARYPEPRTHWLERRAFYELYPMTGPIWGRRYELHVSPEGLDSFLARIAEGAVEQADDPVRVRLLGAWGVDRLLLGRPLAPGTGARELAAIPSFGQALRVYEMPRRAPAVYLARRILAAPHANAALSALADPAFDPVADAVVPGEGPPRTTGGGRARIVAEGPESLEVEVEAAAAGLLVVQRAHLPLWRAEVDGRPAPVLVANLYRMAVAVPAGRHRVRLEVGRGSLVLGGALSLLGAVGLLALGVLRTPGSSRTSAAA